MAVDFYYYRQLDKKKQYVYKAIFDAVTKHETGIVLKNVGYTQADIDCVYQAVLDDNPAFFYLDQRIIQYRWGLGYVEICLNYFLDVQDCMKYAKQVNENAGKILNYVSLDKKTDYEKVKGIHDVLVGRVSYAREWYNVAAGIEFLYAHSILGVLCKKKSTCEGIARTYKLLLNTLGVKCIVVGGRCYSENGQDEEHAWNIVKIDGKPVHVDATNDICNSTEGAINYDFFCISDKQISRTHTEFSGVPRCSDTCYDYFVNNGTDFSSEKQLLKYIQQKTSTIPCEMYMRINYACGESFAEYVNKLRNIVAEQTKNSDYVLNFESKYNEQQQTLKINVKIRV